MNTKHKNPSLLSLVLLAQDPFGDKTITVPGPLNPETDNTGAEAGGVPLEMTASVFLGFLTILGGLLFLVYVIFAALSWVTSGGDKGKVDHAKNQMTNAVIGLTIVLVSQAIVGIAGGVLGLDILNPVLLLGQLWQ